jgi:hypothetical protein
MVGWGIFNCKLSFDVVLRSSTFKLLFAALFLYFEGKKING